MTPTKLPIVLLVDDELFVLEALERDLKNSFRVLAAQNFEEAKALIRSHPDISIILTDESLSGDSGLDLLHWAQQKAPLLVRCMISGKIDPQKISEGLRTGLFHRFFHKPWEATLLQLQLKECVLMSELLKESKMDSLTGSLNRRGFDDLLGIEVERASRHQRKMSLILWDIDHFKEINDEGGHAQGDKILRQFAKHIQEKVRNIDYVARLGGDEFAVILPDTGIEEAMHVASRIHSSLNGEFTISGGVAELTSSTEKPDSLMKRADQALYQSKQEGRNQVQVQD